jgi:hypothetical protein
VRRRSSYVARSVPSPTPKTVAFFPPLAAPFANAAACSIVTPDSAKRANKLAAIGRTALGLRSSCSAVAYTAASWRSLACAASDGAVFPSGDRTKTWSSSVVPRAATSACAAAGSRSYRSLMK